MTPNVAFKNLHNGRFQLEILFLFKRYHKPCVNNPSQMDVRDESLSVVRYICSKPVKNDTNFSDALFYPSQSFLFAYFLSIEKSIQLQ